MWQQRETKTKQAEEGERAESEGLLHLVSKVEKRTNKRAKEAEKIKKQKYKRACGRKRERGVSDVIICAGLCSLLPSVLRHCTHTHTHTYQGRDEDRGTHTHIQPFSILSVAA